MNTLLQRTDASVLGLLLLIGMIVMIVLGRRIGRIWNKEETDPKGGVSSLFAALFALSGLILAFAFGMSQSRLAFMPIAREKVFALTLKIILKQSLLFMITRYT